MKQVLLSLFVTLPVAVLVAQSNKPRPVYVQDGGTNQTLESIFIPPMAGAPFTCLLETEWQRTLADGGTLTLVNQRRIARESSGRFYQERWLLVPKNGPGQSVLSHIQIADPNHHTLYTCAFGPNVCTLTTYGGTASATYDPAEVPTGPLPNGLGQVMRESLGRDNTLGIDTVRTRITKNINAWAVGNDRPFAITREFYFAPSLGINLVSKVSDPRFGSQSFTVTELKLGEPDPLLFDLPKGFRVQDLRTPPAP